MKATPHFTDLADSLLPRSLDPKLPEAEGSPELTESKPYELTAVDQPAPPFAPETVNERDNPLLAIVEHGMDAGGDPVARKVPNDERSKVGTIAPPIT